MILNHADVSDLLARWARERPAATALTFGGTRRTWAELAERVKRVAAGLRSAGLEPNDRIAMLELNHPSCLELTLACAQTGCANAVVNFRLAPPEIAYVINDAKARLLFVGPDFAGVAAQLRPQLPTVERVIHIGGANDEVEPWLAAHAPDARVHPAGRTDCFVQLYTSGTTGFPKGAMLSHNGMLAHARNVAAAMDMGADGPASIHRIVPPPTLRIGRGSACRTGRRRVRRVRTQTRSGGRHRDHRANWNDACNVACPMGCGCGRHPVFGAAPRNVPVDAPFRAGRTPHYWQEPGSHALMNWVWAGDPGCIRGGRIVPRLSAVPAADIARLA
jgi:hypothetical protein